MSYIWAADRAVISSIDCLAQAHDIKQHQCLCLNYMGQHKTKQMEWVGAIRTAVNLRSQQRGSQVTLGKSKAKSFVHCRLSKYCRGVRAA